jgi:molybdopterin-guanine dinucleotide biosynthesis protein B
LTERGYKVAVLKSTKHRNVFKEKEGSDTDIYKRSGAGAVGLVEPERLTLFVERKIEPESLERLLSGFDIAICEGFKSSKIPKIEVIRKDREEHSLHREVENLIGVVVEEGGKSGIEGEAPVFPREKPERVADYIEDRFLKGKEESEKGVADVRLIVNGREVPLKRFVRHNLSSLVLGYLSSLKGLESPIAEVEIHIKY